MSTTPPSNEACDGSPTRQRRRVTRLAKLPMRSSLLVTALVSASLALAACGDSNNDNTTTTAGTGATASTKAPTAAQSTSGAGAIKQSSIDLASQFAGVTPGKADASLPPLVIGFTNQQGASPSFDEMGAAADSTVQFINDHLGGIGGHPLKLDKCIVLSEEDGQKCGARFRNAGIKVADQGTTVVGNASYFKTVGGKFPIIVSGQGSLFDITTPKVFLLDGGGALYLGYMMDVANQLGAKKMALVVSDNPAGKYGASLMIAGMKKFGMTYKAAYVPDAGTTPDYASALQAAGASTADMIAVNVAGTAGCISTFDAMKQLSIDKKVVASFQCYGDPFPEHAGPTSSTWYFTGFTANPRIVGDAQVDTWTNIMTAYGQAKWQYTGDASKVLQDLLLITKFGNELGYDNITPAAMLSKIKAYNGEGFTVPGTINCAAAKSPEVGLCGNAAAASRFANGKFVAFGS
jgi:branched-chain amino acid transport system substrate-binding protein